MAPDSPVRTHRPQRLAVIGMGGYAAFHQRAAIKLEQEGVLRMVATCDPGMDRFAGQIKEWDFAGRGVGIFSDYLEMLDGCGAELDWVVIPTPISLHAEMHRECVKRGLAVYLEKPPTLDPDELEAMISTDRAAKAATNVGFNFIIEPHRRALKRRLMEGDFGQLEEVRFVGEWGRGAGYFARNAWAGKLLGPDGRPLLDSCFGNAMAHFVHNSLFWAGTEALDRWASPGEVRAQLYRAHEIGGPDTTFVECAATNGIRLRFAMTHACLPGTRHMEEILCTRATIRFVVGSHFEIRWSDGRVETCGLPAFDAVTENQRAYCAFLRGETSRPSTALADSRPFVHLNALMYLSARSVQPFPAQIVSRPDAGTGFPDFLCVGGLSSAMEDFLTDGIWPAWGSRMQNIPATARPGDLPRLVEVLRAEMLISRL